MSQNEIVNEQNEIQNVLPTEEKQAENTADLGKFKDVESLLSAYKNLEAEFTKKSQILKSLQSADNSVKEPAEEETTEEPETDNDISPATAVYERQDWKQKVADFTRDNDISPTAAEMIAEEILSDENLRYDERCLEKGYIRYLEKKAAMPVGEEDVKRYLDSNPQVKQSVLRSFITKNDYLPPNPSQRGTFVVTPPNRPRTLKEAGAALEYNIKENKIK